MKAMLAALLALGLSCVMATAQARSAEREAAEAREAGLPAVTVFVDANWGNRTNGAARKLTETHQAWGRHGYQLLSVEPYVENGDLAGFFVSYRRADVEGGTQ
ncbi:hypothetical protein [Pseudomarimonas salicorniae]|uniref:Uncharacterized protein n=1 Tax=Pseudomarimonas salicorniae TaxID=2933270 RepID=A0ABT0GCR8_9GAMM|nr:hypothetical protein [Lysobacter sp. CAU 1642]MCK7592321.1 hypothetical protein [Lysobacter sp. CAU 1642]